MRELANAPTQALGRPVACRERPCALRSADGIMRDARGALDAGGRRSSRKIRTSVRMDDGRQSLEAWSEALCGILADSAALGPVWVAVALHAAALTGPARATESVVSPGTGLHKQ